MHATHIFAIGSEQESDTFGFRMAWLVTLFAVIAGAHASITNAGASVHLPSSEGQHARTLTLNGAWEYAVGEGGEQAERPEGQAGLTWQAVQLPGPFMPWSEQAVSEIAFVWAKRTFHLTDAQAKSLAVLRWNYISLGAAAFINTHEVGRNEPTGPYQTIIPPGVLRAGDNQIVLKIAGTRGARRAASGFHLFPAGFANQRGLPSVTDDIWIDFADRAYMKWTLAMPDLAKRRVNIRVTPTGLERLNDLTVRAQVRPWPTGEVVGQGQAQAHLVPDTDPLGGEHFMVQVPLANVRPWTYEDCPLYQAEVTLFHGTRVLDQVTFRFGMREIGVSDRDYKLNGRTLRLRGSNLVFEWDWGDTITGHEKDYLVTEAREMSMNSFRTHTRPLPRLWADICDEYGTMILAEFPVLYNYQDYKFTPEELAIWHRNCLTDAAGWMGRLWNHPSVIMWVLSNESRRDNAWEEGPFQAFVNALDPTRPTLRTGSTGTRDNYDVHTCGNITDTVEGNLAGGIPGWFKTAGQRTTTNTEYMNYFGHPKTQWAGVDDERADQIAVAQIGAEHTEAMRRARVDGIWPYMYAGWTRTRLAARVRETGQGSAVWKANYAAPASAAWHSALSPVLASLDLFNASYETGQAVTTDLVLINDDWHDARIHVDLLLTKECPEYIPEAVCFENPISTQAWDFTLKADSLTRTPCTWQVPEQEGTYWLCARTTGLAGRAVLSQRFVRAVSRPVIPAALQAYRFILLGGDGTADSWFHSHGLNTTRNLEPLDPGTDRVVIWNAAHLTAQEKRHAKDLCQFAAAGGRIVILGTRTWDWTELCDVKIGQTRGSRAFCYEPVNHPMLSGIQPAWLIRWNGRPGTVAVGTLEGPAMGHAEKILWVRDPATCVAAQISAAQGSGTLLFSQLDVQGHVTPSDPDYDPVAEKILVNMLR
ncbi:MAG: hypothetical protein K9N55_18250 [Phycisphaerae bacterium]|nr:hypothetical protein [Phycisphaerae bacterium]